MPSSQEIAAAMAAADKRNRLTKVEQVAEENVKAFPAFGENLGLRIAMAGAMPGGWSSDHRSETDKFSGWHYIAIHAIYKQVIQATVEVYEQRLVVPDFKKPAPPQPGVEGQPQDPSQPQIPGMAPAPGGGFTKSINEHADGKVAMPQYDPFLKKLKRPNPNQTLNSFNGERAMQLCLTGRVLVWNVRSILTGAIIERYVIPTCLAQPRPPSKELPRGGWYVLPEGARYAEEAGYYMVGTLEAAFGKTIPAEDIQIIKFPHPKYKDDGQSPVSAGALWTDTSEMVDKSRHNHLKQGPDPSVIVGLDADVDEMSMRRAEALFNDRYSGVDKHGRAMFVTPTKTIQPLTTAPKDMSYESGFEQLRDAQLALHGVPLAAVGLSSPTGREGLYAPLLQFIELSVQPILTLLGEEDSALFNNDREREVQIVYTAKKFNDEDLQEKQIQTDIQAGILTKGELRKLRGREPFGDERDDEMCGAAGAPAPGMMPPGMMPPGAVPPGSVPGAPQAGPPNSEPSVQNPEQQAPNQKMPMGRAMQSQKPRLANQIAKALAKQLEAYGILKGGPGSGNFGHAGRPGQVGGSAPDDGGGGGSAGSSPSSSTPDFSRTTARRLENPHSQGIPEAVRRQISNSAYRMMRESASGSGTRIGIGRQEYTNDEEVEIRNIVSQHQDVAAGRRDIVNYYIHERERARLLHGTGLEESKARARETNNYEGISSAEARHHIEVISRGRWDIATAISGFESPALLGKGMASLGYGESVIAQAVNLNRAIRGDVSETENKTGEEIAKIYTEWASGLSAAEKTRQGNFFEQTVDELQAGINPLNSIRDSDQQTSQPSEPEQQAEEVEVSPGVERTIKPRKVPEAVDGLASKGGKFLESVKERASKIKVSDKPFPSGGGGDAEDLIRDDAVNSWYEFEDEARREEADAISSIIQRANPYFDGMPLPVRNMLNVFYDELGSKVSSSSDLTLFTSDFFVSNDDEIQAELIKASGGDKEKLQELKDKFEEFEKEVSLSAEEKVYELRERMASRKNEYINDFIANADPSLYGLEEESFEPGVWYKEGVGGAKLILETSAGSKYNITMSKSNPVGAELPDEVAAVIGQRGKAVTAYNLVFTDESGSVSVTGDNTEEKKRTGRSNELEVFRGVSSAVLAFIQNKDADILTYTAIEEKRQELYDKLTQTIAQIDGKYVALVKGGGKSSAEYYVVKREFKPYAEAMIRKQAGAGKVDWLVKRFDFGIVKSSKKGWVVEYDYFKGGPGSGNFGHAGRPGEVGGSAPDDGGGGGMAGTSPSEKKEKKPAAARGGKVAKKPADKKEKAPKKEAAPKKGGKLVDLENPGTLEVHPASRDYARTSGIKIDTSKSDSKEWNHAPTVDINKWNKENGFVRKGVGKDIDLVDYARKLDEAYGGPPRPLIVKVPNPSKDNPGRMSAVISEENVERAAVALADMVEKADKHNPEWALWYSEIKGVRDSLAEEKGKFNFSPASRELLRTDGGSKLFVGVLAMTSQEGAPEDNLVSTQKIYDYYTEHGELPEGRTCRQLISGKAGIAIANNIEKYKKVAAHFDGDFAKTYDFLNKQILTRDLHPLMAEMGIVKADAKTKFNPGAFADQYVPISFIFGPKIGAFHGNLGELPGVLTQDRWNVRTWGRLTGEIGFTEEQITNTWIALTEAKDKPTPEHVRIAGMSARDMISAAKRVAAGDDLTDSEYIGLNKLAQAHVSSGDESKNPIIKRNDFTTKLNTAMKKITTVVDSPGGALERFANQLAAETAVKILATRGNTKTVREVQASAWMIEKKAWYDAGVGNKRGGENSYTMALEKLRRDGIRVKTKKELEEEEADDE